MHIHIGIVTWNRLSLTKICLESLFAKTSTDFTLTVVDNGSSDGTKEYLKSFAQLHANMSLCFLKRNMGVAVASNMAWDAGNSPDFFVKLDNDIEICDPLWLERLVDVQKRYPFLGPIGYKLCPWHTGKEVRLSETDTILEVPCCNGACALISAALHEKLGEWNEGYGHYGYEDLEYSWRALHIGSTPAYLPLENAVLHRGVDPERIDQEQTTIKKESYTSDLCGQKSYLLHLFLFEKKILPIKMCRKYVYENDGELYRFFLNPTYKPVQKLLLTMVKTCNVTTEDDISRIDFSGLAKKVSM